MADNTPQEGEGMRKKCNTCGRRRPLEDFPADPRRGDGHGSYCRACVAERTRAWRERSKANREKQREWNREHMRRKRGAA
jgi:hypothetical protein